MFMYTEMKLNAYVCHRICSQDSVLSKSVAIGAKTTAVYLLRTPEPCRT